jgi:hypothetical protein
MQAEMYLGQTSKYARLESPMEEVLVAPSVAVLLAYLFLRPISSSNLTEGSHYFPEFFYSFFCNRDCMFYVLKI